VSRFFRNSQPATRTFKEIFSRRVILFPKSSAHDAIIFENLQLLSGRFPENNNWLREKDSCAPVVPPGETGVAVPPAGHEGAEGASARLVEDNGLPAHQNHHKKRRDPWDLHHS